MKGTISVLVLVALATVCVVDAWGEVGHQIVAQIASDLLTGSTNNVVQEYEGDSGVNLPGMAPLPDAYDHTPQGRWSAPMHYCNLPRDATSFQMAYCPNFCVVEAIQNYTSILSKTTNPQPCNFDQQDGIEPCALEFLVHFVGDVHQPLHVGYGDDEGGNTVKVYWYSQQVNLHEVWDVKIIQKWDYNYQDAAQQLESIMSSNPSLVQMYVSDMNPIDWANESFGFVLSTVYNFTDFYNPRDEPHLSDDYYNRNLPVVQDRLIAAGVRLAQLLNTTLVDLTKEQIAKLLQSYISRASFINAKHKTHPAKKQHLAPVGRVKMT